MGFVKPFSAALLVVIFILQTGITYLKLVQPGIGSYLIHPGIKSNLVQPGIGSYLIHPGIGSNLVQPGIGSKPAESSNVSLFRRQDESDLYTYRGHACRIEPKIDPVLFPGRHYCEPSPTRHYKDAHENKVILTAQYFCNTHFNTNATVYQDPVVMPITKTLWATRKKEELWRDDVVYNWDFETQPKHNVYQVTIDWREGCPTEGMPPVETLKCLQYLWSSWKMCDNKGRGGTYEIGCYNYSLTTVF